MEPAGDFPIRTPRVYTNVSDQQRSKLCELVNERKMSVRQAAQLLGLKYNNAKIIARIHRNTERVKLVPQDIKRLYAKYLRDPRETT